MFAFGGGRDTRRALRKMVRDQLARRDITDRRVLAALASVPRAHFVPDTLRSRAYDDGPLPIGHNQTISQPYVVALMTQLAKVTRHSRVLEVGTGCGYQAAVLAHLAAHVWSVERISALAERAARTLAHLDVDNVTIITGDGANGYPPAAPFHSILVTAAAPEPPPTLLEQLAPDGRLVIPVGDRDLQTLLVFHRDVDGGLHEQSAGGVRFVPLLSPRGFVA